MPPDAPRLHGYWRSTAAYRVRIALELKGIDYEYLPVDLVKDGGEQHGDTFRALNPAELVPALEIDGRLLTQSLAICEYLEDTRPQPPLMPTDAGERAFVRALALDVACEVHPLNNLRVQQYLKGEMGQSQEAAARWMHHWMARGFDAIEARLVARGGSGNCCMGDVPGLADVFLVAQAYNADRFGFGLDRYSTIRRVVDHCRTLPAFAAAAPEAQPDARP